MIKYETNERMLRAMEKAIKFRNFVALLQGNDYLVVSGHSEREYYVKVSERRGGVYLQCNCLAGVARQACHHIVSVYWLHEAIQRMREGMQPSSRPVPHYLDDGNRGRTLEGWQV